MKPVSITISVANPGSITAEMENSPENTGIKSHLYLGQTTKQISELRQNKANTNTRKQRCTMLQLPREKSITEQNTLVNIGTLRPKISPSRYFM